FVSPKGGTGKTVISATAAFLLSKTGKSVISIDADFSTRGLTLYLLGSVLSAGLEVQDENCLAEMDLNKRPFSALVPRHVLRDGVDIELVLSNQNLWRGGVPDEEFLANVARTSSPEYISREQYLTYYKELCHLLRTKYDYVIVDARGGYDFTSAIPGVTADRYIIVMEPDKVSVEQVRGFQEAIDKFAQTAHLKAKFGGFLINKV